MCMFGKWQTSEVGVYKWFVKNCSKLFLLLLSHTNAHEANIKTGNIFQTKSNLTCLESGTARGASVVAAIGGTFV